MAGVEGKELVMTEPAIPSEAEIPKKSNRPTKSASNKRKSLPVTVPKPFNLGINRRIEERHQYQGEVDRRRKEMEAREARAKERREEEEKEELKEYRKSLVFKATPIKNYHALTINPSEKELTCPLAPSLATGNRGRKPSDGGSSVRDSLSPMQSNSPALISESTPA